MHEQIENKNSPGSINTIGQKGSNSIDGQETKNSLFESPLMKYIVFPLLVGIILLVISFLNKEKMLDKKIESTNSPGSINTIDQTGDNTIINKLDIPEPIFSSKTVSTNIPFENGYRSEFTFEIDTEVPLKNLYIQANAKNIIRMDINPQRSGMFETGHSGIREEFAFTNIPGAYGSYSMVVITKEKEEINFDFRYE